MRTPPKALRAALVGSAVALLALAVAVVLLAALGLQLAGTSWGRLAIESAIERLTGGSVVVVGLAGSFPDELRAARLELRDDQGAWASAEDVHVLWSSVQLLHKTVHLDLVQAARVQVARVPRSRRASHDPDSGGPPRIDVARIDLERVELGAPLAGSTAIVSIAGRGALDWPHDGAIDLQVRRSDAPGAYSVTGWINPGAVQADLVAEEPAHGLLAGLVGLADVGAVSAQLHMHGTRDAPTVESTLVAGALRAQASGAIDWPAQTLDVDVTGSAPAMRPRADLQWQGATLQAHLHGPFGRPDAVGRLRVDGLSAAGAQLRSLRADVQGKGGSIDLHAVADDVRIPGPAPGLLLGAPLDLRAQVRLDDPALPADFTLSHPRFSVQGRAHAAAGARAEFTVTLPQLAPFSDLAGTDLQGRAAFTVSVAPQNRVTQVTVNGTMAATGGSALVQGLVGNSATLDLTLAVKADEIDVRRARFDARNLQASLTGTAATGKVNLHWHAAIPAIAALAPDLTGNVDIDGSLEDDADAGRPGNGYALRLAANARGNLGTRGFASRPIAASIRVRGLPGAPAGDLEARGMLDDAPLALAATIAREADGQSRIRIERADWKSASAQGDVSFRSGEALPRCRMTFQVARLADLAPWTDPELQGSAAGSLELAAAPTGTGRATLAADLRDLALAGSRADQLHVSATIDDPAGHPTIAGALSLDGFAARGLQGGARLGVKGPLRALNLDLIADLHTADNSPLHVGARAIVDTDARGLAIGSLEAKYRATPLQLLAPAHVTFRDGIAVDRLRIGVAGAVVELAGRFEPALDLTASLRNDASAGKAALGPAAGMKGALAIDARLTGNLARSALLDARMSLGTQAQFTASGKVPFSSNEPMDLRAKGTIDAAIVDSVLAASGRRVRGRLTLDMGATGSLHAPRFEGTLHVADGTFDDDNLGAHLTGIAAEVDGSGASLQIVSLTAHAGPGSVSVTGTVGPLASTLPLDLALTLRNAQPLTSDFVVANIDADIHVGGELPARLDVAGAIKVNHADVSIPNALPPSVGVLDVRWPGQAPAPVDAASATVIGLDLKVDAPNAVFVRGRGIEAEMGGTLKIAGTAAAPQVSGGFDLRRGTVDLAGATLTFNSGRLGFNGTGLNRKIDPTLDFEAQSQSASFTARLDVTGYADAPKIALSSTPTMPQDEILAQLIFGTSVSKLTALQAVQIGSAVATIGGLGLGGSGTLSTVQKTLGLDRLSVGNTPTGATSVEAGRYVTRGVFVGARQMGTAGGTTQALVQIDITKQLKAVGAFGNGGTVQGATPDNDPGNSIGLLYQIEY
jgi:translocation and assembly module TamB